MRLKAKLHCVWSSFSVHMWCSQVEFWHCEEGMKKQTASLPIALCTFLKVFLGIFLSLLQTLEGWQETREEEMQKGWAGLEPVILLLRVGILSSGSLHMISSKSCAHCEMELQGTVRRGKALCRFTSPCVVGKPSEISKTKTQQRLLWHGGNWPL